MKLHDAAWGALLVGCAVALYAHVRGFPSIPGQQVGPNALPTLVAAGLGVCGAILLVRGLRDRLRNPGARWVEWPDWFAARRQRFAFAVLVAVNLFYLLAAQALGFVITGSIYLYALMAVLRVPPARALVLAVLVTLAIHACFYKLLKVPLPWGVLQRFAW